MPIYKTHEDWSCMSAYNLIITLAWAATEQRIDPNSEAVKSILEQLAKPFEGEKESCTECQIGPTPQERFIEFLKDERQWQTNAQHMCGYR
ncbi:MAG: hypothetical protein EKK48_29890 [Candidatus Melainabacteria bacterium]|nr:MAG: hypothetical protein EKK48_29890 [Candidatus Melainabacteria bacterium]